jgi:hypothetical protein
MDRPLAHMLSQPQAPATCSALMVLNHSLLGNHGRSHMSAHPPALLFSSCLLMASKQDSGALCVTAGLL